MLKVNRGKMRRTEKGNEKVKKEADGNQAVGFCLKKAPSRVQNSSLSQKGPKVESFVTKKGFPGHLF